MYLKIDHNSGIPISAQMMEQVKYRVVSGQLMPGEKIPSVRGLATQLKLNPTTVARVYRQLEAEGVIFTQQGRGTFIAFSRSGLTLSEKKRRLREQVRKLVVESGHIGLGYADLVKLIEEEIGLIEKRGQETAGGGK